MIECPCGASHSENMSVEVYKRLAKMIEMLGPDIPVQTPDGVWTVPRIYIAMHGMVADELPDLAARYGWMKTG